MISSVSVFADTGSSAKCVDDLRPYRSLSCFALARSGHLVSAVSIPGRSRPTGRRSTLSNTAKGFANTLHSQEADLAQNFPPPPVAAGAAVCVCQFPRLVVIDSCQVFDPMKSQKSPVRERF